jgi:prepilin-type N-terminal cleavage/methylation domain-containing protein
MGSRGANVKMPISPTGRLSHRNGGFTLLEIVVGLLILGILTTLGIKAWSVHSARAVHQAAQQVTHYLLLLQERAHTRHQVHRVYWDLDRQEARCMIVSPQGDERPITDPYIQATWHWPVSVRLRDVWTHDGGYTQEGQRRTTINPIGQLEPTALHFHTIRLHDPTVVTVLIRSTTSSPETLHGDILFPPRT